MLRIWLLSLFFLASVAQAQVIQTWSFDTTDDIQTEKGWTWMEEGDAFVIDSTIFREGTGSMRIDCAEGYCGWWWELEVEPEYRGGAVVLSADIKSSYTNKDEPAYMWIRAGNDTTIRLVTESNWNNGPKGESEWERYSVTMPVPENATKISISLESGGMGSAWFDNMTLVATTWTKADAVAKWFKDRIALWTSSWYGWLKILMVYAFLPGLLLGFAARSKRKETVQPVPWALRWFGLVCLIMVSALGTTIYRPVTAPLHLVFMAGPRPDQVLYALLFAGIFTGIWYRFRDRIDEVQLWRNLTVVIRYFLVATVFTYAIAKVYRSQFMGLTPDVLDSRFGDRTSMRLLWQFFGQSYAYVLFAAAGQFVGCFLLLGRKTYQIGALILIMVFSNIVFVNYAYDIPVKYPSTWLLIMMIFLILEEVPRWLNTLYHRATELSPAIPYRPGLSAKFRIPLVVLLCGYFLWHAHAEIYDYIQDSADKSLWVPEMGVWTMDESDVDFPADSSGNSFEWNRLILGEWSFPERRLGGIQAKLDDEVVSLATENRFDSLGTFLLQFKDSTDQYTGRYTIDADTLRLSGIQFGDSLDLTMIKRSFILDPDPQYPMWRAQRSSPEEPESED